MKTNLLKTTRVWVMALALIFAFQADVFAQEQEEEQEQQPPPPVEEQQTPIEEPQAAEDDQSIVAVLAANENYSEFANALQQTGLDQTLEGEGSFTIFAPTNDAFAALPEGTLDNMSTEELTELLRYHIVPEKVTLKQASEAGTATSVTGQELTISGTADGATVNDAGIVESDIKASNGVIHGVDAVLMVPTSGAEDAGSGMK